MAGHYIFSQLGAALRDALSGGADLAKADR
jgi:hypothetical protein